MKATTQLSKRLEPADEKVDGPGFCRLLLSHRSLYRADSREHHILVDDQAGIRYIIDRTAYLNYLQSRNS